MKYIREKFFRKDSIRVKDFFVSLEKKKRLSPNGERHHIRINLVLYGWRMDKANISFNIYIVICWLYDCSLCWLEINIFFSQVQSREIMKNRIVFSAVYFVVVRDKDFTWAWLSCFSRLGPSCYSCYSTIILILIISKIFETNPSSIYLSLSMRGNIWRWIANSVVATVGTVAHIYEFLTLLLGVPSQGFIAVGCQEDCKVLRSVRTDLKIIFW